MTPSLIGITTYRTNNPAGNPILALGENYVQAISQAGGIPRDGSIGTARSAANFVGGAIGRYPVLRRGRSRSGHLWDGKQSRSKKR